MLKDKSFLTNFISVVLIGVGYLLPRFGKEVTSIGYFAFSGAITNWLAIHMLFEKVPFCYGSGVVPNRFEEFKVGIRSLIMEQFFTPEKLKSFFDSQGHTIFSNKENIGELVSFIDYDVLFKKLIASILSSPLGQMLGLIGGAQVLESLKPSIVEKLRQAFKEICEDPAFQDKFIAMLSNLGSTDQAYDMITSIVASRLEELTPTMVKNIVKDMIDRHLGWLVVWGGVLGGLIGLVMAIMQPYLAGK
ncbi:MAG: DUF445 domain-containing protein [Oligoflexales bacterium]